MSSFGRKQSLCLITSYYQTAVASAGSLTSDDMVQTSFGLRLWEPQHKKAICTPKS